MDIVSLKSLFYNHYFYISGNFNTRIESEDIIKGGEQ